MKKSLSRFTKTEYTIFAFAVVVRVAFFVLDTFNGLTYIDEAMTTLNAFEIAKSGRDLFGDKMPLYFDTWLTGGQSPMATYFSALFVKMFGETKIACRIPVLVTNILSLAAFFGFVNEVFNDKKRRIIMYVLSAVSPWMIFSSAFLLDCNYSTFFIAFALYFLAKAINNNSVGYYISSMAFFGLSFYCYMAVAFYVPPLLIIIFVLLIVKKKIDFKKVAISFITIFVVCIPFILLGLITTGVLPKMKVLGFGIENMDYYSRQSSISLADSSTSVLSNFINSLTVLGATSLSFGYEGINKFQFSNLCGGLFILFAVIKILLDLIRKKKTKDVSILFFAAFLLSAIIYCFFIGEARNYNAYRYAPIEYSLIFLEGLGIAELEPIISRIIKSKKLKKVAITAYAAACIGLFVYTYNQLYVPQIMENDFISYGDPYYMALDRAESLGFNNVVIQSSRFDCNTKLSVFTRYRYYGKKDFVDLKDELLARYNGNEYGAITTDGSIIFSTDAKLNGDCCIYLTSDSQKYDKVGYTTETINAYEIAYKSK